MKKDIIYLNNDEENYLRYYLKEDNLDSKNNVPILFKKYDIMHNTSAQPSTSMRRRSPHKTGKVMNFKAKENWNKT